MSGISELNPFVGPRPIQRGERLHGRKAEVRELAEQLEAWRIVVLHSPSGAGKSSLVQAGLIPRLRAAKFDVWKPIRVNLDPADFEGVPADTNRYILSALVSLEDELPEARRRSPAELAKLDFLEYLDARPRRKNRAAHSVVLLFDQFEEVLSVAPRAIAAKEQFFAAVGRALDTDRYWALFIIREDYLAALAPYRDLIPTQLRNSFRLDLLGLAGAREAAVNLAREGGREFPAVDKLIRDLCVVQVQRSDGSFVTEQGIHVEPVHLQVVCRRLWDAMPEDDLSIDAEDIEVYADVSRSLAGYYADAVRSIAGDDAALERALREWVGTKLIVGGIRSQVRQETGSTAGLDNEHIAQLLDSYLVRAEQRAGANWFELCHDRLVEPILADNEAWEQGHLHPLQVQAKAWDGGGRAPALLYNADGLPGALAWAERNAGLVTQREREFLEASTAQSLAQKQKRQRQRRFTAALAAVAVVAIAFGVVAFVTGIESERRRELAEDARRQAEEAQRSAESSQRAAEESRAVAQAAQRTADGARTSAEKAQKENERAVRQMFEVSLRRFVDELVARDLSAGAVELDPRWSPLLTRADRTIVAATVGQEFHLVVAGHELVLGAVDDRGNSLFLEITIKWLLRDQARRGVAIITPHPAGDPRLELLERSLSFLAYEHEVIADLDDPDALAGAGALIIDDRREPLGPGAIEAIEAFVEGGGGLLAVGAGARWLEAEPAGSEPSLERYAMNQLMGRFGARWTDQIVSAEEIGAIVEPAAVRFENESSVTVNVYLRARSGEADYYTTLDPGEVREILTAIGQEWLFRDASDERELGESKITQTEQVIAIGADAARERPRAQRPAVAKPAPTPTPTPTPATKADKASPPQDKLPVTLSSEDMATQLAEAKKASRACGETHQAIMPTLQLKFVVTPDGAVSRATTLPPMKITPEAGCVEAAVSKLRFPKSRSGIETIWKLPL